jgi:flagellar biosynthetic protein FliO
MLTSALAFALVLGMLAALVGWTRRAGRRRRTEGRHMQVIESLELSPGRSLHLVQVGGRGIVVSCTAQRCDLLCELETLPAAPAAGAAEDAVCWPALLLSRLRKT